MSHHPRYEVAEGEFVVTRGQNELTIPLPPEFGQPDEMEVRFLHLEPPPCDPHHGHNPEDTILWKLLAHGGHFKFLIAWSVQSETRTIAWKAVFR
jgi:hypothetical protein